MGGIDLDPCASVVPTMVKAERNFTVADDGLSQKWEGRVFTNPPNPAREWWEKTVEHYLAGDITIATYIAYSQEQLQQSQKWSASMLDFPVCILKDRIRFMCTARDAIKKLADTVARRVERASASGDAAKEVGWTRAECKRLTTLESMPETALVEGDAPPHSSSIVGVGWDFESFQTAYGQLGHCVIGTQALL